MNERRRRKGKCFLGFYQRVAGWFPRFYNVRRRCAGESLIEQLCSLLVAALAFLILSGAAVSGAKVDANTRSLSKSGVLEPIPDSVSTPALSLRLVRSDGAAIVSSISMNWWRSDGQNLYHYDGP